MGKKIISFSVYGNFPLYSVGAIENIQEAKEYFPGWTCRFYCSKNSDVIKDLTDISLNDPLVEVVPKDPTPDAYAGTMWRFSAIGDTEADYIIIRDTDQRLNDKDAQMVNHWISTGLNAHRAHEEYSQHALILMGCAFGIKGGVIPNIDQLMDSWLKRMQGCLIRHRIERTGIGQTRMEYGSDQVFLKDEVWPLIEHSCATYGIHGMPFPPYFKPLKWGGNYMYRRITPFTNNKEIFGNRPQFAYDFEEK